MKRVSIFIIVMGCVVSLGSGGLLFGKNGLLSGVTDVVTDVVSDVLSLVPGILIQFTHTNIPKIEKFDSFMIS